MSSRSQQGTHKLVSQCWSATRCQQLSVGYLSLFTFVVCVCVHSKQCMPYCVSCIQSAVVWDATVGQAWFDSRVEAIHTPLSV